LPFPNKLIAGLAALAAGVTLHGGAVAADGHFTAEQATRGQTQFNSNCGSCHGMQLEGGVGPALKGVDFLGNWGTAGGIYDYFSVAMPPTAPGKLGEAVYVDILAYILSANGLAAGSEELTADPTVLGAINLTEAAAANAGAAAPAADATTETANAVPVPQAFTWGKSLPTKQTDGTIKDVVSGSAAANP